MATYSPAASADDANEVVSSGNMVIANQGPGPSSKLDGTNDAGFRFPSVTIAQGGGIASAILKFPLLYASTGSGKLSTMRIYGENVANSAQYTSTAYNLSSRKRTNATIEGSTLDATAAQWQTTGVDVTRIVQEVINRSDWSSGNALSLMIIGNGTAGNYIQPYMYDYSGGSQKAQLIVTLANGTSFLYPASVAQDAATGDGAWSNITNVLSENDSSATADISGGGFISNILRVYNFGFNIPSTANINGIEVQIKRSGTNAQDQSVRLTKSNIRVGYDNLSTDGWPSSLTWKTYGGVEDQWGVNWTAAEINSSGFGVALQVANTHGGGAASVDAIKITVYYNNSGLGYYNIRQSYQSQSIALSSGNQSLSKKQAVQSVTNYQGSTINLSRITWLLAAYYGYVGGSKDDPGTLYDRTGTPLKVRMFSSQADATAGTNALATWNGTLKSPVFQPYDFFLSTPYAWTSGSTLWFAFEATGTAGVSEPDFSIYEGYNWYSLTDDDVNQAVYTSNGSGDTLVSQPANLFYIAYDNQTIVPDNSALPSGGSSMSATGYPVKYGSATSSGDSSLTSNGYMIGFGSASLFGDSKMIADRIRANAGSSMSVDGVLVPLNIKKTYLYKIYDKDWNFLGVWNDVVSEFGYSQEINSAGAAIDVTLARNSDTLTPIYDVIGTDDDEPIITDDGMEIVAETTTANSIGPGTTVDLNLNVKVYEFSNITQDISGDLVFTGYISKYTSQYGSQEQTVVSLFSYGADMDNWVLEDGAKTRVPFYSMDPSDILTESLNAFNNDGGIVTYDGTPYRSLIFNGTSDYFKLNSSFVTSISASSTITISAWFKITGVTIGRELLAVNTSAGDNVLFIGIQGSSSKISIFDGVSAAFEITSTMDVNDGVWHQVVYVKNGSTGTMYVDGVSQGSHTINYTLLNNDSWSIGQEFDGTTPSNFWNGNIDDIRIWNTVLNSTQVSDMYAGTIPSGVMLEHTFDDDLGNTIKDTSGNGYDTTQIGTGISYSSDTHFTYTGDTSIDRTNTVVTYAFNVNTMFEVLKKCLELAPTDWYFYVDLAENVVHFHQRPTTPDHYFYLGKHIVSLNLEKSQENIVNLVYASGGQIATDVNNNPINLFKKYKDQDSIDNYRRGLDRPNDGRVKDETSLDIIAQSEINRSNAPRFQSKITISNSIYEIRTIKLGQLIGFRNFGNFVDTVTMQVVRIDYKPDEVTLQLDTLLPSVPKRLEDIKRNLNQTNVTDNPDSPTS